MKISVLVAAYNRLDYLKECLESANNQTLPRDQYEVIVVDDGSQDDLSPIEHLCDIYYRFEFNKGISEARNMCMELAKGEYYFVLDSDDVLEPECLQELLDYIELTKADMVFCRLPYIGSAGEFITGEFPCKVQAVAEVMREKLIPHPSTLIRKSSLGDIKYDPAFSSAVDLDFLLAFMTSGERKIKMLDRPLYRYRLHGSQESFKQRQQDNAILIRKKYENIGNSTT